VISVYHSAQQYLEATQQMLEERELENNLILGLCNSLIKKDTLTDHCVFINSIESGQVMSTSIKTAERAIVSCRTDDTRSVKELAEYFHDQDIRLSGVFGEHLPAEAFACFYGGEYFIEMTMIVHCLNRVNELSIVPGSFRVAVDEDKELIMEWTLEFRREADASDQTSKDKILDMVRSLVADGNFFLWMDKGMAVSMAAINRKTRNVGVIGHVYTPEEFRRKGYATAVVQNLSEYILQNGFQYCGLFTDKANPTSNHIYSKIGYEPSTHFTTLGFRS
jgi:predicted GNAT family acetyltransferase